MKLESALVENLSLSNAFYEGSASIICNNYKNITQPALTLAATTTNNSNYQYNSDLNSTFNQGKSHIVNIINRTTDKEQDLSLKIEENNILNNAGTVLTSAGQFANATGFGASVGSILNIVGLTTTGISAVRNIFNAKEGFENVYVISSECNKAVINLNSIVSFPPEDIKINKIVSIEVQEAAESYKAQLDNLIDRITHKPINTQVQQFYRLDTLEQKLNSLIKEETYNLQSKFLSANFDIADFDSLYIFDYLQCWDKFRNLQLGIDLHSLAHVLDSTNIDITNDLLINMNTTKLFVDSMILQIAFFNDITSDIQASAYIMVTESKLSKFMPLNSSQEMVFTISNKGAVSTTDLYGKLIIDGGFTSLLDSFYIGTIAPGTSFLLQIPVNSPSFDTIGTYKLILRSNEGAICNGTGGAISASDVCAKLSVQVTNSCYNSKTGKIIINAQGNSSYSYQWSSGQNSSTINTLQSGYYTVTVTDTNGICPQKLTIPIYQLGPLLYDFEPNRIPAICSGQSGGAVQLTSYIYPNTFAYTYLWNTNETTPDIYNLAAGSFNLTLTEINGQCPGEVHTFSIGPSNPLSFFNIIVTPESSPGLGDAHIEITGYGGSGEYNFLWNDGLTGPNRINLFRNV